MFKCMAGYVTNKGKFLKPLSEKLTYFNSRERCEGLGLQIQLPHDHEEEIFIGSFASFSSNWLRIQFDSDKIVTDDEFRGKTHN